MDDVHLVAILAAAVGAFLAGGIYYGVLGDRLAAYGSAAAEVDAPSPWLVPVELVRGLLLAAVVGWLVTGLDLEAAWSGVAVAVALWVGFPVVLLAGSVFHERVPWRLAALHAGDWLLKLLVVSVIVTLWR